MEHDKKEDEAVIELTEEQAREVEQYSERLFGAYSKDAAEVREEDLSDDELAEKLAAIILENSSHFRPRTPEESLRRISNECLSYHLGSSGGSVAMVASKNFPGIVALAVVTKEGSYHLLHAWTRHQWNETIKRADLAFTENEGPVDQSVDATSSTTKFNA